MIDKKKYKSVIVGAGAAGVFASIQASCPLSIGAEPSVLLLEKSQKALSKVKVSGGGRCNVTHACFDPAELIKNYPRGSKELLGGFSRFHPQHMIDWLQERSVMLKTEEDGRMFPITDDSQTIIDCLLEAALDVKISYGYNVVSIKKENDYFVIQGKSGEEILSENLMLATGSSAFGHTLAKGLGHTITETVPSLFTFNIPNSPLCALSGVSVETALVSLPAFHMKQMGPILLTHWGFSGPAVLKLSAYAARDLCRCGYQTDVGIDWLPSLSLDELRHKLQITKEQHPLKCVVNDPHQFFSKQLWKLFVNLCAIPDHMRWGHVSKQQIEKLVRKIKEDVYRVDGKTTHKQEFVTCGGVELSEVNFKTMESKIVPGLYFGGEILDIDGITGGFNFQAAWTTGWLAGHAMRK